MAADPKDRALAKLTAEAARSANDLAALRHVAVVLPMEIRVQLNNAIEEVDLLRHRLHEGTLLRVVGTSDLGSEVITPAAPAHSRIGPSQAELIWHCPGSVKAQEAAGPRVAGEAAERGTGLHALAEECLRTGAESTDPVVAAYVDVVRKIAGRAGAVPLIEQRLDLARYHPELFGTADAVVVDLTVGVLTVGDFKSGLIHVPCRRPAQDQIHRHSRGATERQHRVCAPGAAHRRPHHRNPFRVCRSRACRDR